jgi:hypothetical protein
MAKLIANSNTVVRIDNASGALKDITSEVTEIDGAGKAFDILEVTSFGDSEVKNFMGLAQARSLTLRGVYNNGSSDADVHLRARLGNATERTVEIKPDGTRMITGEYLLSRYDYDLTNKEVIRWEAEFIPTGKIQVKSTS